jgi:hypothetical protein
MKKKSTIYHLNLGFKENQGFTLLELIISCGILLTFLLAFFQSVETPSRVSKKNMMAASWLRLMAGLYMFVDNGAACGANLLSLPFSGLQDMDLGLIPSYPGGLQYYSVQHAAYIPKGFYIKKTESFENLLYVQDIVIERPPFTGMKIQTSPYVSFFTFLRVQVLNKKPPAPIVTATSSQIYGEVRIPILITINLTLGGAIVQCVGPSDGGRGTTRSTETSDTGVYDYYYPVTTGT